jgi:hypothetical protein
LGRPACASSREGRRHLTCENDRAKPDHISRLACSTNLSKILEGGPPKRYPLDRGPDSRPAVLELDAHRPISPLAQRASAFLREPFKVIKVPVAGQRKNPPEPLWITRLALRKKSKERPAKIARAARARGRSTPGSCNGLFSVGFPTGVQRCTSSATRKTLRTSFPLPLDRAGHTATGRLHCSLLTLLE